MVEVTVEHEEPQEGEVLIVTLGGTFLVKGTMHEIAQRLSLDEWPIFELAQTGDRVIIRTGQVVALREGTKPKKGNIGFHRP